MWDKTVFTMLQMFAICIKNLKTTLFFKYCECVFSCIDTITCNTLEAIKTPKITHVKAPNNIESTFLLVLEDKLLKRLAHYPNINNICTEKKLITSGN